MGIRECPLWYTPQRIIGPYVVDFAFPHARLAVECDGSYWHSLPGKPAKDRKKDGYLRKEGWTVLRLTEDDIHASPEACRDKVLHALTSPPRRRT